MSKKATREVVGRDVAALLNPRPLCLIGAVDGEGRATFATVAWTTPVSHTPPLLAFSLRAASHTFTALSAQGCCSVNVCGKDMADTAIECGTTSGRTRNKGKLVSHHLLISENLPAAVPTADDALSTLACRVESIAPAGDHQLVVAQVVVAQTHCTTDEKQRIVSPDTLLCLQSDSFVTVR